MRAVELTAVSACGCISARVFVRVSTLEILISHLIFS